MYLMKRIFLYIPNTELLLRIGVAFAFAYPAISAWFSPYSWVGYFPPFVHDAAGAHIEILLHTFGLFELGIAAWILFGKRILVPSAIAAASLFLIVVLNLQQMDVLFRDIPILLMALALVQRSLSVSTKDV